MNMNKTNRNKNWDSSEIVILIMIGIIIILCAISANIFFKLFPMDSIFGSKNSSTTNSITNDSKKTVSSISKTSSKSSSSYSSITSSSSSQSISTSSSSSSSSSSLNSATTTTSASVTSLSANQVRIFMSGKPYDITGRGTAGSFQALMDSIYYKIKGFQFDGQTIAPDIILSGASNCDGNWYTTKDTGSYVIIQFCKDSNLSGNPTIRKDLENSVMQNYSKNIRLLDKDGLCIYDSPGTKNCLN